MFYSECLDIPEQRDACVCKGSLKMPSIQWISSDEDEGEGDSEDEDFNDGRSSMASGIRPTHAT